MWPSIISIGVGAALGALLRWWLSLQLNALLPSMPLGTLAANLLGGFLMGLAMQYIAQNPSLSPAVRVLMTTGFLGGLTTFSTFSAEVVTLILQQDLGWAALVLVTHVAGSLVATLLGVASMRLMLNH
jgi:fluoride exporter